MPEETGSWEERMVQAYEEIREHSPSLKVLRRESQQETLPPEEYGPFTYQNIATDTQSRHRISYDGAEFDLPPMNGNRHRLYLLGLMACGAPLTDAVDTVYKNVQNAKTHNPAVQQIASVIHPDTTLPVDDQEALWDLLNQEFWDEAYDRPVLDGKA